MFSSWINAVYTRSINDPILAGKFTGKQGKNTIAIMGAKDETSPYIIPFEEQSLGANGGKTFSTIARYKRDVLKASYVGLLATDRHRTDEGGGSNTTFGADAKLRFNEIVEWRAQVQGSYTTEPNAPELSADFDSLTFGKDKQYDSSFNGEKFGGVAMTTTLLRSARHWNGNVWYEDYSPTFRAENGFVTQNNYRMAGGWTDWMFYFDKSKWLERIEPQIEGYRKYNYDGVFKDGIHSDLDLVPLQEADVPVDRLHVERRAFRRCAREQHPTLESQHGHRVQQAGAVGLLPPHRSVDRSRHSGSSPGAMNSAGAVTSLCVPRRSCASTATSTSSHCTRLSSGP
jgi:hypothetical protein